MKSSRRDTGSWNTSKFFVAEETKDVQIRGQGPGTYSHRQSHRNFVSP